MTASIRRIASSLGLVMLAGVLTVTGVAAQSLSIQVESREIHAGVPFILSVSASGFNQEPTPEIGDFTIKGCVVIFQGVTPNVSRMLRIVNGRRTETNEVTFVFRFRVEAEHAGRYEVAPVRVTQGNNVAMTRPGAFTVQKIEITQDMQIEMHVPERPVWVGETFEVTVDWYLRRDPRDRTFVVPLFDAGRAVEVAAPRLDGRPTLTFAAGARSLELPYDRESVSRSGLDYTRFRFSALVTANRVGALELPPVRVAASLESGTGRDSFGFRMARRKLYKAEGKPTRLSIRALPQKGRPAGFGNAIGTAFSVAVQASRTVVRVGDPIELTVTIRGNGRLEGLSLPNLAGVGGLDEEHFSIPHESPSGELSEDGKAKTFAVTVRLRSSEVSEIPPLELAYFDPVLGQYQTVESRPIALSVAGSVLVGAADVVGAAAVGEPGAEPGVTPPRQDGAKRGLLPGSLVGADLSLSSDSTTLTTGLSKRGARPFTVALYLLGFAVLGSRMWLVRTGAERGRASSLRRAVSDVEEKISEAGRRPARDAAPELLTALRALARQTGASADAQLLERIEIGAFDPASANEPLPQELRDEARRMVARITALASKQSGGAA